MGYCTISDIQQRISVEIYDRLLTGLSTEEKTALVNNIIASADARIDHSGRTLGDTLKKYISTSISAFLLYNRFGNAPDGIRLEYQEALKLIGAVFSADIGLLYDPEEEEEEK